MTSLTLTYREDPRTGLPRLDDPNGGLSADALAMLGREVGRQFERLVHGPNGQYWLPARAGPGVPRCFRVTVTEREKRCPTLLLEAAEPPAAGAMQTVPERWQAEFLAEAARWLAEVAPADADRAPLDFILADLRDLLRNDPRQFLRLLFAGYLHVGDALSRRHGEPGESRYAQAARLLGEAKLPVGVLDPLTSRRRAGWLRRLFSAG